MSSADFSRSSHVDVGLTLLVSKTAGVARYILLGATKRVVATGLTATGLTLATKLYILFVSLTNFFLKKAQVGGFQRSL